MEIAIYAERPDFQRGAVRGPSSPPPETKGKNKIDRKCLFEGKTGQVGNFMLLVGQAGEDTGYHPRHRHDFDQIRYAARGDVDFGPGAHIPEGCIGYFPAGTYYGPYEGGVYIDPEIISSQFEGAHRADYVSFGSPEVRAAIQELSKTGEFKNGVYRRVDADGRKHNQDGLEASMDFVRGGKTVYPPPRYAAPIVIDPRNFDWIETAPGAYVKELGRFTERETRLAMIRIERSGPHKISSPDQTTLHIVIAGAGEAGGRALSRKDGIRLDPGEEVSVSSGDSIEFLLLGLPKLHKARAQAAAA